MAGVRYRQVEMRLAAQDLHLRRDPASPAFRLAATARLRLHAGLALEASLFRSRAQTEFQATLSWSPFASLTICQAVRLPDQRMQSGLQFNSGWMISSVWMEPTPSLGVRVGVGCALHSRSSRRR
jgi:hypothetical protein